MEHLGLLQISFLIRTEISQRDGDTCIEVSQLAHTTGDDVVLILCCGEDGAIGPELLTGTSLIGIANYLHVVEGLALLVLLLVDMTIAVNLREHVGGKGVHTADTHTVETTRHLVGALVELTTSVEHCHDDLEGTLVHLLVLIDRDTTSVVLNGDGVIFIDRYFDMRTIASHRLVDRVVDGLVDQMVESLLADVTNIHRRALTYGFKSLEHLNIARGIILFLVQLFFCHFSLFH